MEEQIPHPALLISCSSDLASTSTKLGWSCPPILSFPFPWHFDPFYSHLSHFYPLSASPEPLQSLLSLLLLPWFLPCTPCVSPIAHQHFCLPRNPLNLSSVTHSMFNMCTVKSEGIYLQKTSLPLQLYNRIVIKKKVFTTSFQHLFLKYLTYFYCLLHTLLRYGLPNPSFK